MPTTVQQLARELGMTSQEVMTRLAAIGRPADSHLSEVDDTATERLRRDSPNGRRSEAPTPAPPAPPPPPVDGAQKAAEPAPPAGAQTTVPEPEAKDTRATETGTKDTKAPDKPAPAARPTGTRRKALAKQLVELPLLVALAFGIAVVIKIFLVQAFFIPSVSMLPTLRVGDRVLVEKLSYRFGQPGVGQVIVFEREVVRGRQPDLPWQEDARNFLRELLGLPVGSVQDYIKRVVATGGDVIRYEGKPRKLFVNGKRVPEPYLRRRDSSSGTITADNCESMELSPTSDGCRVPAGSVFVMGDNRGDSQDSRFFGPVNQDKIVGRARVVIWPPKDIGGL